MDEERELQRLQQAHERQQQAAQGAAGTGAADANGSAQSPTAAAQDERRATGANQVGPIRANQVGQPGLGNQACAQYPTYCVYVYRDCACAIVRASGSLFEVGE